MKINKGDVEIFKRKFNFYSKKYKSQPNSDKIEISISPLESKSVNIPSRPKKKENETNSIDNKTSIEPNCIIKTDNGYEIYFDSYQKRNDTQTITSELGDPQYIKHSTQSKEVDANDLLLENPALKNALISNDNTYNSLEEEFFFNNNNNNNLKNTSESKKIDNKELQYLLHNNNAEKEKYIDDDYQVSDINSMNNSNVGSNNIIINFAGNSDEINHIHQNNNVVSNSNIIFQSQLNSSSVMDNYNNIDISMYSKLNSRQLIKKKIFQQKPLYNLSSRIINDENRANSPSVGLNESYKFISTVNYKSALKKKMMNKNRINLNRILHMKRNILFRLIQFIFEDIDELRSSLTSIEIKVNEVLTYYYFKIVEKFKEEYKNDLELYEYFFMTNTISLKCYNKKRKKNKNKSSLDLYIKSRIISNFIEHSHTINLVYKAINEEEKFSLITWKFDLLSKCNLWVASESEEYNGVISRFSYRMPVISYSQDDFMVIKISLMSQKEFINIDTIQWVPIKKEKIDPIKTNFLNCQKNSYYASTKLLNKNFDELRFCEFEKIIHIWKNVDNLRKKTIVDEIKMFFKDFFSIESFEYDIRKFYLFKIKLKATKVGVIRKNKYFNFDIEIKPSNEPVVNQTQCLGILNWVDLEKIEIRIGEYFVGYLIEIYG